MPFRSLLNAETASLPKASCCTASLAFSLVPYRGLNTNSLLPVSLPSSSPDWYTALCSLAVVGLPSRDVAAADAKLPAPLRDDDVAAVRLNFLKSKGFGFFDDDDAAAPLPPRRPKGGISLVFF